MGDIAVDIFLETLKQLITSSNSDLIIAKKDQLQSLENEIKDLRGFLKITEKKRNEYSEVMKLVMQIRDVVSEAENIVELFVSHAFKAHATPFQNNNKKQKKKEKTKKKKAIREHQDHLALVLESVKMKINTLMAKVKEIYKKNMYDLKGVEVKKPKHSSTKSEGGSSSSRGTNTSKVVEEKTLVGFEDEVKTLMGKLHDGGEDGQLEIISIIGAGGGGKTTLAREVYNRPLTSHKFEILAWVNISQDYNKIMKRNLLISILESASSKKCEDHRESCEDELGILESASPEKHEDYKESCEDELGILEPTSPEKHKDYKESCEDELGILESTPVEKHEDYKESCEDELGILESASPKKHKDYRESCEDELGILESTSPGKNEDCKESSEDELGEKVYNCLKDRKYLIVMDDIWDIEAWNDIQRSFPKECNGSKVMLTSRLPVQPASVPCVRHCLNPLPKSCSWELLQKKVFGKKQCPPELVDIGEQIAEKCKGLPLAVIAIAGILATEDKTLGLWEKIAKHLSSIIAKNQEDCMEILELSYNHLPLHLKACFLYIGAHPEDYEIPVRELIWLWIAEGFIQQSDGGKSLEAVAKDYLIALIDRSLVMEARKSKSHGGIKSCRIHDLLRELCLRKAEEDTFLVQNYRDDSFSPSATNKHRRLFIDSKFLQNFPPRPRALNLRSFLFLSLPNSSHSLPNYSHSKLELLNSFMTRPHSMQMNLSFFVENFELLRVLHVMSVTSQGEIGIGDLVHLRYLALGLREGKLNHCAPNCFHCLSNLETLNLQVPFQVKISLPRDIVKMVKLRHLYTKKGIFEYHHVSNYDEEEGNMLDSLQTLHRMCICEHCLRFLERTPNLRKLGLCGDLGHYILADLAFFKCLEILYVYSRSIKGLKLPPTLTRLTLFDTGLKWEDLSIILQTQPSLEVLKLLRNACVGRVWNTSELEEGFFQLKYLKFEYLNIKEWNASEDQFPSLEVLVIENCKRLKRIPIDFANLNELREIDIRSSCLSAEESAREIQEKQRNTKGDDECVNTTFRSNNDDPMSR